MKITEHNGYCIVEFMHLRVLVLKEGFNPDGLEIAALEEKHKASHLGYDVRSIEPGNT